ncbi:MAG TPA: hypothetical protein VEJ87_09545 [Acidimicrobiales bacterium]|nr:hypothetical protein [Acidimicrobiales bacterium]
MRRIGLLVLAGTLALGAASCSSQPSLGSLQGKTPEQILDLAQRAALADHFAFQFVDQTRSSKKTTTLSGYSAPNGAQQSLAAPQPVLQVVQVSNGDIYVRGALDYVVPALGISTGAADSLKGRWVLVHPGQGQYSTVTALLNGENVLTNFEPVARLSTGSPETLHGREVVGISGTPPPSAGSSVKSLTLFVPTTAPHTPVGAALTLGSGSSGGTEVVVFKDWGAHFYAATPQNVVEFSALTGT